MPEKTPHPHFIDGAPPVAGEVKVLSPEEQARAEYAEALGELHEITGAIGAEVPGDVRVDSVVADYVQEGLLHCGDDTACTKKVLQVGVAEVAQPESQPETAGVIAKLLDEDYPGVEGALKTAEMAGVDMEEVVREINTAEKSTGEAGAGEMISNQHGGEAVDTKVEQLSFKELGEKMKFYSCVYEAILRGGSIQKETGIRWGIGDDESSYTVRDSEGGVSAGFLSYARKMSDRLARIQFELLAGNLDSDVRMLIINDVNEHASIGRDHYIQGPGYKRYMTKKREVLNAILDKQIGMLEEFEADWMEESAVDDAKKALRFVRATMADQQDIKSARHIGILDTHNIYGLGIGRSDSIASAVIRDLMEVRAFHESTTSRQEHLFQAIHEKATSDGISLEQLAESGIPKANQISVLREIARAAGLDINKFNESVMDNISRDIADLNRVIDEALDEISDGEVRKGLLRRAVASYLKKGNSERTARFAMDQGIADPGSGVLFWSKFDMDKYVVYDPTRYIQTERYMIDMLKEEDFPDERKLLALDAVDALYEYHLRGDTEKKIDIQSVNNVVEMAADCLDGDERISALSLAISCYERADGASSQLVGALKRKKEYVPSFDDFGRISEVARDKLIGLDSAINDLSVERPLEADALRLVVADMAVHTIEQALNGEGVNKEQSMLDLMDSLGNSRDFILEVIGFRQRVLEKRGDYIDEIKDNSTNSIIDFYSWTVANNKHKFKVSDEDIPDAIEQEVERIKDTIGVSINVSPEALESILFQPPYKFLSVFEVNNRSAAYDVMRSREESVMGIKSTSSLLVDEHPIYGAVMSDNGRDEFLGAAPGRSYGDMFVTLRKSKIADRTVVVARDSFYSPTRDMRVTLEDAPEIVAINNLVNAEYAEAQILGGVSVGDIETINIDKALADQQSYLLARIREECPDITINIVDKSRATRAKIYAGVIRSER